MTLNKRRESTKKKYSFHFFGSLPCFSLLWWMWMWIACCWFYWREPYDDSLDSTFEDDFDSQRHILSLYITYRRELVSSYPTDKKYIYSKSKVRTSLHLLILNIQSNKKRRAEERTTTKQKHWSILYSSSWLMPKRKEWGIFLGEKKKYGPHTVGSPTGKFLYASNNNACIYKKVFLAVILMIWWRRWCDVKMMMTKSGNMIIIIMPIKIYTCYINAS